MLSCFAGVEHKQAQIRTPLLLSVFFLRHSFSLFVCGAIARMRRVCLCIAVTVTVHDWAHSFVCNTATQHTTLLARRIVRPRAHCSCMAARIAVVAAETDEAAATALGQRLGGAVVSLADVMKGRKGRKTDKVKATAVYEAITAAAADDNWVLTGFPENALQGTLFQKLGGSFDQLVVVQPAAAATASDAVLELVQQYKDITVEIPKDTPENMAAGVLRALDGAGTSLTTSADVDAATDTASSRTAIVSDHAHTSDSPETSKQQDSTAAAAAVNRQTKCALKASSSSKDTTATPTAAKLFDADSSDAIAVPWYAAVAKTTSKSGNKKSAVTTAALALAAAADATPSKIVQTLGASQSSSSTDSSNSSSKSKKVKLQQAAAAAAVSSTIFGDIELDIKSAECLVKAGITVPTPIQSAAMARIAVGISYHH
jgi:hypothetical protein